MLSSRSAEISKFVGDGLNSPLLSIVRSRKQIDCGPPARPAPQLIAGSYATHRYAWLARAPKHKRYRLLRAPTRGWVVGFGHAFLRRDLAGLISGLRPHRRSATGHGPRDGLRGAQATPRGGAERPARIQCAWRTLRVREARETLLVRSLHARRASTMTPPTVSLRREGSFVPGFSRLSKTTGCPASAVRSSAYLEI